MDTLNRQALRAVILDSEQIEKLAHRERAKATRELIQAIKRWCGSKANRDALGIEDLDIEDKVIETACESAPSH
jgi:hypothetical protein